MRRIAAILILSLSALAHGQVWEKMIAPGLTYRQEVDLGLPRIVHAIRWSPGSPDAKAMPELANGSVYSEDINFSRETVSEMTLRTGAIAGLNADFFPFTGDPLGLMVRNGVVLSKPFPDRSVFGWGPGASWTGTAKWKGAMTSGGTTLQLDGVNEECGPDSMMVNFPDAGWARGKGECLFMAVRMIEGAPIVNGAVKGEVYNFYSDVAALPIRPENCIVVATGSKREKLRALKVGDAVTIQTTVDGLPWDKVTHAVGGGPNLLTNGKIAIDAEKQGFKPDFSTKRHPRTAVGRTTSGEVWWVAIDGRQSMSVGATLEETAHIMLKLGCVDAINLDGGGSTTMHLLGVTLNRPSDGKERAVANGVVFFSTVPAQAPAPNGEPLTIIAPEKLSVGDLKTLSVQIGGVEVPSSEVIWAAQGSGWIDQGGLLRAVTPGSATIKAWARGQLISAKVEVIGPTKSANAKSKSAGSRGE